MMEGKMLRRRGVLGVSLHRKAAYNVSVMKRHVIWRIIALAQDCSGPSVPGPIVSQYLDFALQCAIVRVVLLSCTIAVYCVLGRISQMCIVCVL
jgi:hypothetical protein